ncbi:MAG: hypothetical protein ACJ764_12375 [Solirubrobacteraceae bacterium]
MSAAEPRRATTLAALTCLAWLAILVLPALSAAATGAWSRPVRVDDFAPTNRIDSLKAVQCPSTSLCVAVDDQGNVITSTKPGGGRGTWKISFPTSGSQFESGRTMPLQDLGCPAAGLCVLGGGQDDLLVSTNPTGGPDAWSDVQLPGSAQMQAVSCPSSSLCLAADVSGNVFYSTNPAGSASAWHEYHVAALDGAAVSGDPWGRVVLSCPSENFCAAVNGVDGAVVTTVDPQGGSSAWTGRTVDGAHGRLQTISCPSQSLCVAFDGRNVITSTAPTTASWTSAHLDDGGPGEIPSLSCPRSNLCLASFAYKSTVFVSRDPAGGAAAWQRTSVGGRWTAVSCPAVKLCVGVNYHGRILTSSDPPAGRWALKFVDGYSEIRGLSCPAANLCVAVDAAGKVLTSSHPTGGPHAWRATRISIPGLTGISCPARTLCLAIDATGDVLRSTHPTGGRSAWKHVWLPRAPRRGAAGPGALSCPTVRMCLAVGGPYLWTTTHPTRRGRAWKRVKIKPAPGSGPALGLRSATCHGPRLCVIGGVDGDLFVSRRPTRGPGAWTGEKLEDTGDSGTVWSATCPSLSVCLAADGLGALVTSTDPAMGAWGFTFGSSDIDGDTPENFHFATCASTSLCFLYGTGGILYTSHHPRDASAWQRSDLDPPGDQGDLDALACLPKSSTCLAADDFGDILIRR